MRRILRQLKFAFWVINGYVGREVHSAVPQKVTVLITYFNPIRMKEINPQIRNILKCTFVDKLIISNHNPDIKIEDRVFVRDNRLSFINQDVPRACGYRWRIASAFPSNCFIIIDDDIFLFPGQLKVLFESMIRNPTRPHGFSGLVRLESGDYEYREHEDIDVHYLCEVYAVTKEQIKRYFEMEKLLGELNTALPDAIEKLGDYILISQTTEGRPAIHSAGRIFRNESFKTPGIANHKNGQFENVLAEVSEATERIKNSKIGLV